MAMFSLEPFRCRACGKRFFRTVPTVPTGPEEDTKTEAEQ